MDEGARDPEREAPLFDAGVCACVATLCVIASIALSGVRHDDAFITFRYAENLARGLGPVFNPGERVLGTTAPGHMLLGALVYGLLGKAALPSAMAVLGCIGWSAQALGVFALLRVGFSRGVAAAASLAVALGAAGSASFIALETNLVVACVVWSLALLLRGRSTAATAVAAVAGLLRPDAYLYAVLIGAYVLWQQRKVPARPLLVFAAITLPWQLFALGYYGSMLPQSARTKYQNAAFSDYLVHELGTSVMTLVPVAATPWLIALAWLVVLVGAVALVRRRRGLWLVVAYGGAHLLAYAWLRPFKEHIWHLYPLRLTAAVLAAAAFGLVYERTRHVAARALVVACAAALLAGYAVRTVRFAETYATAYWFGARDAAYMEVAAFLRRHAQPADVVAAVEVGTIGYWSECVMYDWGRLITPKRDPQAAKPQFAWIAVDDQYFHFASGQLPARVIERHGFRVSLFNTAWLYRALWKTMLRFPGLPPDTLMSEQPELVAAELATIVANAEAAARRGSGAR